MHWVLLIALSILAGGWFGGKGAEDDHAQVFKRLSSECRAELLDAARDEPPGRD
jgi:hypothetical protein